MRNYQEALQLARETAEERFEDREYTITTRMWCDGDFRIQVRNGFSSTEESNALAREIVVTPHQAKMQLVEVVQSEMYTVHSTEVL